MLPVTELSKSLAEINQTSCRESTEVCMVCAVPPGTWRMEASMGRGRTIMSPCTLMIILWPPRLYSPKNFADLGTASCTAQRNSAAGAGHQATSVVDTVFTDAMQSRTCP